MKHNFKEADLATHFINSQLQDQDVYKEVPCSGIIDIVSKNGVVISAFECKMTFSFDVIEQAVKNKRFSHYSYIVVPKCKSAKSFAWQICREYGIGVIEVKIEGDRMLTPYQSLQPTLNRKISKPKLFDWQKKNTAGVQSGRITAFSNTVSEIVWHLKRNKDSRIKTEQAISCVNHHYSTSSSAVKSLMNMCRQGVIKEFYFDKGYIILRDTA